MTGIETALIIAGTAVSAVGAISVGQAQKQAADYNAAVAQNNAIAARRDAKENARRQRRLNRKKAGTLRLQNVSMDVLEDNVREGELQALDLLHAGEVKARGLKNTAQLERMEGKAAQRAGYFSAAGTLLRGGAKAYGSMGGGASSYSPGSSAGSVNANQGIGLRDSSGFIG